MVDTTLVRYRPGIYSDLLSRQATAEHRIAEDTFAGLRFVRNRMGYDDERPGPASRSSPSDPAGRRVSGDLDLPFTERSPPRDRRAELAVYGQIQHIAVAAAAVLVLDDGPGLGEEP